MGVYLADRRVRRDRSHVDGPSRKLSLTVTVADPEFWRSANVMKLVVDALELVSGDAWFISFEPLQKPVEFQRSLFEPWQRVDLVSLYSGGLDSAAGLAAQLRTNDRRERVTVTAWHQSAQREFVQRQLKSLGEIAGRSISSLFVRTNLRRPPRMSEQELTQRCRGFLFMALAGVVAIETGARAVEVFENGIGALNLPPMVGMSLGGRSTKNCHPGFLRIMSELVSLIAADRQIEYVLPYQGLTKAELVAPLHEMPELEDFARATVSCVHFPRRASVKQCGLCPGCLGRRQALRLSGINEPHSLYEYDIFGSPQEFDRIPYEELGYLKATLMDVYRFESLSVRQVPDRICGHIFGTGIAKAGESIEPWLHLLQRYRDEWSELANAASRNGARWGHWFSGLDVMKRSVA